MARSLPLFLCLLALLGSPARSRADVPARLASWLPGQHDDPLPAAPPQPDVDPSTWTRFETDALSGIPTRRDPAPEPPSTPTLPDAVPAQTYYAEPHPGHRSLGDWYAHGRDDLHIGLEKIRLDYIHQYTGKNLRCLGLTLALVAPLANTDADENFQNWYRQNVRSAATDRWGKVGNRFGEHWLTVPVFVAAAAAGFLLEDCHTAQVAGDWGKRSIRALIVGSPTVGILQVGLGAGRPGEYEHSSRWRPFHDKNGVAGHGFVGAVPFLTAARMTDNRPLKALFFAGSFWTCWARVNGDSHYLSQAILGWTIAYLAVDSVNTTEDEYRRWQLVPLDLPQGGTGIGVMIRY